MKFPIDNLGVDTAQSKSAVQHGTDQLALVLTTDATVPDFKLVELTDDKHLQNADYLIPIVNTKTLHGTPWHRRRPECARAGAHDR